MTNLKNKNCPAIQAHIALLQGIISRMANNSANCKSYTVTIIAAMLVIIVSKDVNFSNIWICYIPLFLFYFLDCYYLGLERFFIQQQKEFVKKIPEGNYADDVYVISGLSNVTGQCVNTIRAAWSFSTTPFYGFIAIFVFVLDRYH